MSELANWKCHKIVKAGKILTMPGEGSGIVTVEDTNGVPCKVEMPPNAWARGRAALGDYIVIYEDGYKSWSPANAFEDGYSRMI